MAERQKEQAPTKQREPRGATPPRPSGEIQRRGRAELTTEQGKTSIADVVVAKVAGISAREVSGVHDMGTGTARAFGVIRERIPVGAVGPSYTQGVSVEVGQRQAAVDLDIVMEYGVSIPDVAQSVRDNVIQRVERMTGLEVTEVNVTVDDIWLGETEEPRVE